MVRSSDLSPWAFVHDTTTDKLYEVRRLYGAIAQRSVELIDVASDEDHPRMTSMLLVNALKRLELVRAAPNADSIATVAEWGRAG